MMASRPVILAAISMCLLTGCSSIVARFMVKSFEQIGTPIAPASRIADPIRPDAALSVLWAGHATVLVQIHDKIIVTDPLFTRTVGMIVQRSVAPGLDPAALPRVDMTLISHTHFDHMSFGSLDMLPPGGVLAIPDGALRYTPALAFDTIHELKPWDSFESGGVRVTAVPVQHFSGRYGFDILWMRDRGYTGYIIEYRGIAVFFAGDTGYHPSLFRDIGSRFDLDLAILPIGPIEPRDFMQRNHVDPGEALRIFRDVRARRMLPIHHKTINQGFDPSPDFAINQLRSLIQQEGLSDRLVDLDIGQQQVLIESAAGVSGKGRSIRAIPP